MHVIIEGPDGAGKTTLARTLKERYGFAYHHEGPPPEGVNVLHHYARLLLETERPTVFDRFHLGETVYGPLLRGASKLSPRDLQQMDRLIVGLGVTVLLCLPCWETCLENNQKKDEFIKDDAVRRAAWVAWHDVKFNPASNTILFDYTVAREFGQLVRWPAAPAGVVGPFYASTLIVGEQPNGDLDLPFFGNGNSSQFLHDCLEEAGVVNPALTNAVDAKNKMRDLGRILSDMPAVRSVVLLGKVAEAAWARVAVNASANLHVSTLPHPAYWKRFKSSQKSEYVRMLKEASSVSTT